MRTTERHCSTPGSDSTSLSWAAWLGGDYDDTSYVSQTVTVPGGTPYLGFWHWIASADSCGWDFMDLYIGATIVDELDLCSTNNTGGWVHRVVNLSAYSGTSVSLKFEVYADLSGNSNWFLDDVAWQASPSPIPSPATARPDLRFAIPRWRAGP